MFVFFLIFLLFILIGLQLPAVVDGLDNFSTGQLIGLGAGASAVVILIRPVWVFPATWLPRLLNKRLRRRDPIPPWQQVLILAWSGMRGVVSLAAALALPTDLGDGRPLPARNLIIFLAFCVILSTLVLQGLSLPFLIRRLGVTVRPDASQEREARLKIAHAPLAPPNTLAEQQNVNEEALHRIIGTYEERLLPLTHHL